METVLIYRKKLNNQYEKYQIVKATNEKINDAIEAYNKNEKNKSIVEIVTDKEILSIILQHKSSDTIKSHVEDFERSINDVKYYIYELENTLRSVKDFIKEKFHDKS